MITLLLTALLSTQASAPSASTPDAAVFAAQDARLAAVVKGDVSYLDGTTDGSLTYHHSSGSAQTKDQFLKAIRDGALKYKSLAIIERKVRRFGSAAVVTGIIRIQALSNGEVVDSQARFTDTYESKGGKFVHVAWQSTRLAPPVPAASPTLH